MSFLYSFDTPPLDAIAHLKAKRPELHFDYDEILHEAHHKAFTVAKVVKLDLLSDIQESLIQAQQKGQSFQSWKKELIPTLKAKGWWGETEVTNPATGEVKTIFVGSRRLKTIYDTNMRTSYAVGRYKSQMMSDMEYLRYSAILDSRTRPSHSQKHGIVLPKTDPWWDINYPPNGWRCRCKAQAVSKSMIEERGWKVSKTPSENIADRDWAYHVGKDSAKGLSLKTALDNSECNAKGSQCGNNIWTSVSSTLFNILPRKKSSELQTQVLDTTMLLPKGKPDKYYVEQFLSEFGATINNGVFFKDVVNDMMYISDEMFVNRKNGKYKVQKNGREIYIKLFAQVIKDPLEVWVDVVTDGKHIKIQKRYIDIFVNEAKKVAGLVIFDQINGVWRGTTAFNVAQETNREIIDYKYIDEKVRKGVLLYERR